MLPFYESGPDPISWITLLSGSISGDSLGTSGSSGGSLGLHGRQRRLGGKSYQNICVFLSQMKNRYSKKLQFCMRGAKVGVTISAASAQKLSAILPRNQWTSTGPLHETARTPTAESCLGNLNPRHTSWILRYWVIYNQLYLNENVGDTPKWISENLSFLLCMSFYT